MRFSGGGVGLLLDPADGGRITSLTAHGREWLAPSSPRVPTESFMDAGTGGWDECAPTLRASILPDGTVLRDHGDAWRSPWAEGIRVSLPSVGVTLERTLAATASGVRLSYTASTASSVPVPLLWSAHPLFLAPPGTRIVATGTLTAEYPVVEQIAWPASIDDVPGAVKAFTDVQEASIRHADGVELSMRWSLPHAGFYWDSGEFTTTPVVAIEPTTGRSDSAALVLDQLPVVRADEPLEWWVEVG
jgi:hypothetical protein